MYYLPQVVLHTEYRREVVSRRRHIHRIQNQANKQISSFPKQDPNKLFIFVNGK